MRGRDLALGTLISLAVACSGPQEPSREEPTAPVASEQVASPSSDEPVEETSPGTVSREQLSGILGRSVGDFLRLVEVEPELQAGTFVGYRLLRLPELPPWLDLQVGDVVTAINGLPIERPEDAQRVWETLQVASEVRLELRRQGARRAIRIAVTELPRPGPEDESATPSPQLPSSDASDAPE